MAQRETHPPAIESPMLSNVTAPQQVTSPALVRPQVRDGPAVRAVRCWPTTRPTVAPWSSVPSWPDSFAPQQYASPPPVSPQVCAAPATSETRGGAPATATGRLDRCRVPSPNCPLSLVPQQYALPAASSAQMCAYPAAIETSDSVPGTGVAKLAGSGPLPTGFAMRSAVVQQYTPPLTTSAHACFPPIASERAVSRGPSTTCWNRTAGAIGRVPLSSKPWTRIE